MISLKKAFEYENYLKSLTEQAAGIFNQDGRYRFHAAQVPAPVKTETRHYKSRAYAQAEDEVVMDPSFQDQMGYSPDDLTATVLFLLDEQDKLLRAKNDAKLGMNNDYDYLIQSNDKRRKVMPAIERLIDLSFGSTRGTGTGYRFNEEGNETPYTYPTETITSPDFDLEALKTQYARLLEEAESTSAALEEMVSRPSVDYHPPFVRNTKLPDVVAWVKKHH